jgi:2-keto-4-pentenoate hydratase
MDQRQIVEAATLLAKARREGVLIAELPERCRPAAVADGHAVQDAVAALLGEPVGGFKASAPPNGEPTRGAIFARTIHGTPARVPAASVPLRGVEGEVAFRFRRDLPARPEPYTRQEVAAAVDACAAIEVVDSRFQDYKARGTLEKLADNASNGAFVHAEPVADWQRLDLPSIHVTLSVNGQVQVDRNGGHPTSDPLGSAVALVEMLRGGGGVRAGQFVTCGTYTGIRFLQPGDTCAVHFDGLGDVEVTFAR